MDAYMPMAYTSIFMAAKLDREVASNERMLSVKSHNPMITWIHQVKCQKKRYISIFTSSFLSCDHRRSCNKFIFPIPRGLRPLNLA